MDIPEYIKAKNKIYNLLLEFLESDSDDDFNFTSVLTNNIDGELKYFLSLLSKISKNHRRTLIFNKKINQILKYLSKYITKYLTNSEIFDIFKSNKQILYILFQNHILVSDEYVSQSILSNHKLSHFFYPEIQKLINKEDKEKLKNELQLQSDDASSSFEIKRQIGENDSYICKLIRNDSIEEFVSYINRTNMNVSSIIKPSYYETNSFLLKKEAISLIEYSAFFGSIQIFQYLVLNNCDFTNDLWLYAIHGKNAEIIHHLENLHIEPNDKTYSECLKESIKCHHNEIAEYIQNNLLNEKNKTNDDVIEWAIRQAAEENQIEIVYYLLMKKTKIDDDLFQDCKHIEKIAIPPTITSIGNNSFQNCTSITGVSIPSSIKSIGECAFSYCTSLKRISIPSSVTTIEKNGFTGCDSLTKVSIAYSITILSQRLFYYCRSLKKISIPSSVTKIKKSVFFGCRKLENVYITSSVKSIGKCSFYSCYKLKTISIPPSLTKIAHLLII